MHLIHHYLLNQKWFWRLKNVIYRIYFYLHRYIVFFRGNFNKEVSYFGFFWDIVKTSFESVFFIFSVIALCEIFESFHITQYRSWNIDAKDMYSDIATIFTALIGIYFATISIVVSSLYKSFSKRVANLIWNEKFSRFYHRYLTIVIVLSLILEAIEILGYTTGYLIFGLTVILGIGAIICFLPANLRLFSLFSPAGLLRLSIAPNTKNWILRATTSDKQSNVKEIQTYSRREVDGDITALENMISSVFEASSKRSESYSEEEIRELVLEIVNLLYFYSLQKCKIPHDSLWFEPMMKHKEWFRSNSSEVLLTEISLIPDQDSDKIWFEKRMLNLLKMVLDYIESSKNHRLAISLFNLLQESVQKIASSNSLEGAILLIEYLRVTNSKLVEKVVPDISEQNKYTIEDKISLPLAVIDNYGAIFVSLILGFIEAVKNLSPDIVLKKVRQINWLSKNDIYNYGFTDEIIIRLEYLRERLEFEHKVEGKIISQDWYINQMVISGVLDFLSKIPNKVKSILDTDFVELSSDLKRKNNQFASLQVINRGIEACTKAIILAHRIDELQQQLQSFVLVKDIPHAKINIEQFLSDIRASRRMLVKNFASLSGTVRIIPKHHSIPDYFGGFYWFIGQECLKSIIEDDFELFGELFPAYYSHTFAVYDHFLKEDLQSNPDYWVTMCSDLLMDLFCLSGYALIYKELGYEKIWKVVDDSWKKAIGQSSDSEKWIKGTIKIASNRETFFSLSTRSEARHNWRLIVWRDLIDRKFVSESDQRAFYPERRKRKHKSDILEILYFGISDIMWHYESQDIFVAFYLLNLLKNKDDADLSDKVKSILREISRLDEYED